MLAYSTERAGLARELELEEARAPRLRRTLAWRPKVKLMYFNIDGLGEPIRLALAQAGVPFDDHRFKEGEFAKIKPTLAFGQVPCLVVDGREIVQTASILRCPCAA